MYHSQSKQFVINIWLTNLFVFSGMMNCRPGIPFPMNDPIGDYLENSKNGVIFVSFGSVIKGSLMTIQNKRILIRLGNYATLEPFSKFISL